MQILLWCSRRWGPTVHNEASLLSAYTGCAKKTAPNFSCNNFGKYGPILIMFSLFHSQMNWKKARLKSTTSPQICCCTTLWKLNVQLYSYLWINICVIEPKLLQEKFGTVFLAHPVHLSVRLSTKNLWMSVGFGWNLVRNSCWQEYLYLWVLLDSMPCDPLQGQGHKPFKVRNSFIFNADG